MTETPDRTPQSMTFAEAAYLVEYPASLADEQADRHRETIEPWRPSLQAAA